MGFMATLSSAAEPTRGSDLGRGTALWAAIWFGAVSLVLLVGLTWLALRTATGQWVDESLMGTIEGASPSVMRVLGYVSMGSAALALAGCITVALLHRGFVLATAAAVLVIGASLSTQLIKAVLERPDVGIDTLLHNSLPSGHTTVVAAVGLAALLAAPGRLRGPLAALVAAATTLTGVSTILAGWHRPADVLTAVLVALVWGAIAAGATALHRSRGRARRGRLGWALLGSLIVVAVVTVERGGVAGADTPLVSALVGFAIALSVGAFARLADRAAP
jgi:membrane-associated phospholipid phosphatase